jgi:riboflavin biosynthesis pyrimidine reductase
MPRPHIILHMISSVNGKILTAPWRTSRAWQAAEAGFDPVYRSFATDGWVCGRVTMEQDFADEAPELLPPTAPVSRDHLIGDPQASTFAVAIDPGGKLGWTGNAIEGDHLIEVLSEQVTDAYLHYLQRRRIFYLICGRDTVDLAAAMQRLAELFPIRTLLLQGGGYLNGSMFNLGLVDEVSLMLLPVADSHPGHTALETGTRTTLPRVSDLQLVSMQRMDGGVVWLRYR